MKPLRLRLEDARGKTKLPWEVLERDYLLSWILAGLFQIDNLRGALVFKGGTALKKCWLGDHRFSEDLDFTAVGTIPTGTGMETAVREACNRAVQLLDPYAPINIVCERHEERDPHPSGQEAFDIRAKFPWHRNPQVHVMVEISMDEKVLKPVIRRNMVHEYGEPLEVLLPCYSLEEIVAEKLRAILQHDRSLEQRGWARSRARDFYDLWRVLGNYRGRLDLSDFPDFLREKCDVRGVKYLGPESFFPDRMLSTVEKTWEQWLGPLVTDLPSSGMVIEELRPLVATLLATPPGE